MLPVLNLVGAALGAVALWLSLVIARRERRARIQAENVSLGLLEDARRLEHENRSLRIMVTLLREYADLEDE